MEESVWKPVDESAWKPVAEPEQPMGMLDKVAAAGKQLAGAAISPITGIPDAVRSVADFLRNPNEWARKHFSGTERGPGEVGDNPLNQAVGSGEGAVMAHGSAPGEVLQAAKTGANVAKAGVMAGADAIKQKPLIIPALTATGEMLGGHPGAVAGSAIGSAVVGLPAAIKGGLEAYRDISGQRATTANWRDMVREAGRPLTKPEVDMLPAPQAREYLNAAPGNVKSISESPKFSPEMKLPASGPGEIPKPTPNESAGTPTPRQSTEPTVAENAAVHPKEASARADNATSFAKLLKESGISHADASGMDAEQWQQVKTQAKISEARAAGKKINADTLKQKAPSETTIKAALEELKKLEDEPDMEGMLKQSIEQAKVRRK